MTLGSKDQELEAQGFNSNLWHPLCNGCSYEFQILCINALRAVIAYTDQNYSAMRRVSKNIIPREKFTPHLHNALSKETVKFYFRDTSYNVGPKRDVIQSSRRGFASPQSEHFSCCCCYYYYYYYYYYYMFRLRTRWSCRRT